MSVNIEHIGIDQEHEYMVESILTDARSGQAYSGSLTLEDESGSPLQSGTVVDFLDAVIRLGKKVREAQAHIYEKRRTGFYIRKLEQFRDFQADNIEMTGDFVKYPTQPDSAAVEAYKATFK